MLVISWTVCPFKTFHPILFASKAGASKVKHLSGVAFWDRLLALPTTKLERVVRDKDSSLLRTFVNYGRKKFLT
jgi:hypothetical protein